MSTLFDSFEKQRKANWLAKVTKDLKGRTIEELDWQLMEGLVISPFAHREDLLKHFSPIGNNKATNIWEKGVLLKVQDFSIANKRAISALENGATAICFDLNKNPSKEELSTLLENIQHEWISTHFQLQLESWKDLSENFLEIIQEKGQDLQKVNCSFNVKGNRISEEKEMTHFKDLFSQLPLGRLLAVNTCDLFSSKEKVVAALAATIHKGNDFLAQLNKKGFQIKEASQAIQFSISLTDSYFLNIATIRALKLLWQQVLHAWDETIQANTLIVIHLGTQTQTEDEHYNKIKATAQAMSAVIGGADRLFIYPSDEFKEANGSPFSERIALNVQHLMQLESYMDRVIDPAAGSYYIESLTQQLAEKAWAEFQQKQVS